MSTGSSYSDKKTLLKLKFPIWDLGVSLAEGQYELPFSIQLPAELIPSFKYHTFSSHSSIEHTIEAIIGDNKDVMSHGAVIWINKNPSQIVSPISAEASFKVSNCFCFSSGTTEMKSTLNLSLARVNEELITTSQIVNSNNRYNINTIRCSLIRTIRLKARKFFIPKSCVFSIGIQDDSKSLNIKSGQSNAEEVTLTIRINELSDTWKMPSVSSEIVDCEYEVKVQLEFDNSCGLKSYEISLPVEIVSGAKVLHDKLSEPPKTDVEWNPMMISEVNVHTDDFLELIEDNKADKKGTPQQANTIHINSQKSTIKNQADESTPLRI
jgi:hypothetical protein